jgi:hypothetical protein
MRERAKSKTPAAIRRRQSAYWAAVKAEGNHEACHVCSRPNTVNYKRGNWCADCSALTYEERCAVYESAAKGYDDAPVWQVYKEGEAR